MTTIKRISFLLLTACFINITLLAIDTSRAQAGIDNFAAKSTMKNASLSIALARISDGKIVAGVNTDLACITASTMKTVTSTAALERLGGDFVFETPVYLDGEVKSGVLNGNILIVGRGDPTLGSRFFKDNLDIVPEVITALKGAGITRIEGKIVVDKSLFPYPAYNGWWDVGDLAWSYAMGIHALNYCDNRIRLIFDGHDGQMLNAHFDPEVPGLRLINLLEPGNKDNVDLHAEYATPAIIASGTVTDTTYYFNIANPLPDALLADSLKRALNTARIKIREREIAPSSEPWLMLSHRSPILTDIITSLLERSDNMFTEGLLRAVALQSGKRPTAEEGVSVVNEILSANGIDVKPKFQLDGSGLARANKAPASFFTQMLTMMANKTYGARQQRLVDLMPRVGINARIGSILSESSLSGSVAVKSGSMQHVQCFVGYYPADNPEYCFAILVNNWHGSRATLKDDIDRLILKFFNAN